MAQRLRLEPCTLAELGSLAYTFSRGAIGEKALLVAHLSGELSNDVSSAFGLASAIIMAGLEAWQPSALILDFRGLVYEWGDQMESVLLAAERWSEGTWPVGDGAPAQFPMAVVVSEHNRQGLESLLTAMMDLEPRALLFDSIDAAAGALEGQLADDDVDAW